MIKKLFSKVKKLDHNKQELLYDIYYNKVYKTAYFITQDSYLAQDVLQETFIKVFQKYDTLKDKEKVNSWLISITTRTAIDMLRKEKIRNHVNLDDVNSKSLENMTCINNVESEVDKIYERESVRACLEKLPYDFQTVLVLKYIHGISDKEIANILSVQVGTVKSRLHRAKTKMKQVIEESELVEEEII
ncbi:RNA polymerase sigma factor [Evansella sp. AB-rgal1]|uniref:RNA polymerase sigma factor n=1 Tax=Evansella sp. AB-rgal1 TaxID=3242696 RepID=UPI00359D6B2C